MRNRILKNLPRGVLQTVAVLLLATLPLAAAGPAYVKQYTPMLSAPSEKSGKPLKNLAINEVVTVVYTEEALEQTDLSQAWVRIRASDGREGLIRLREDPAIRRPRRFRAARHACERGSA